MANKDYTILKFIYYFPPLIVISKLVLKILQSPPLGKLCQIIIVDELGCDQNSKQDILPNLFFIKKVCPVEFEENSPDCQPCLKLSIKVHFFDKELICGEGHPKTQGIIVHATNFILVNTIDMYVSCCDNEGYHDHENLKVFQDFVFVFFDQKIGWEIKYNED